MTPLTTTIDWLEIEREIIRVARPGLRRLTARVKRKLKKKWRRYQLQKRKQ